VVCLLLSASPLAAQVTWTAGPPLAAGLDHHATFVTTGSAGALLHVLGGNNYREQFATHWTAAVNADGSLAAWREATPLPAAVAGHTVLVVGRTAVVLAGQHTGRQNTAEVFTAPVEPDGSLGAWAAAPPLPAPRFHHAAVAAAGHVYVLGGLEATTSTNTVFRAPVRSDGTLGPWVALDTMPHPRSHQAALVHSGAIYQVGGLDGNPAGANRPLNDVLRARLGDGGQLGPWERVGQLDSAYGTHAAFTYGGFLYVAGGVENNRRFTDAVRRAPIQPDGLLGGWELLAPLPAARGHVHHLPVVRNTVYSVGGSRGRQVIAEVVLGRITATP
jgi:N-acetylneuraminic acid mutarotase